jgi:hypothetical protein
MIQLSNPMWLWGLTATLIPIAIHLLSRKEGKTIYLGSIRHLRESDSAQFSSIRLNEIILLIIRCLLIAVIVLLLSGLKVSSISDDAKKWVVIEPGVEHNKNINTYLDSLNQKGYEVHRLAENFPMAGDSLSRPYSDYWAAVEELRSLNLKDVIVISYGLEKKFVGDRVPVPDNFRWINVDKTQQQIPAYALSLHDTVWTRLASFSPEKTSVETRMISSIDFNHLNNEHSEIRNNDSITITIVSDVAFSYDQKIVLACLRAIQKTTPRKFLIKMTPPSQMPVHQTWTIWLSNEKVDERKKNSIGFVECRVKTSSLLIPSELAGLSSDHAINFDYVLTARLNEEIAIQQNLAQQLASIILNDSTTIQQLDSRVLPEQFIWSQQKVASVSDGDNSLRPIDFYLIALFMGILIAERWLAFKRNQ